MIIEKIKSSILDLNTPDTQIMSAFSHEIRTPMNAILGISEILLQKTTNPEEKEYLKSMEAATRNLLMTVNNIMDYEGIKSGDIKLNDVEFNIDDLIEEVCSLAKINLNNKEVSLIVDADPLLPKSLRGDALRIKQVLSYLLTNTVNSSKDGHISLKVEGEELKKYCVLSFFVTCDDYEDNTGMGLSITKSLVELMGSSLEVNETESDGVTFSFALKLKMPAGQEKEKSLPSNLRVAVFMQDAKREEVLARMLTKLEVSHTCLGNLGEIFVEQDRAPITHLFVEYEKYREIKDVKELNDLGFIYVVFVDSINQVEKRPRVMYLKKPVWHRPVIDMFKGIDYASQVSAGTTKETIMAVGVRILVVDDNDINLKVTKGLLQPYGISVDTAVSGSEAINLIRKNRYDMVYMDHMMPGMDGCEATRAVRNLGDPYYMMLPIIALSANAVEGSKEMFTEAGMNDFLYKPVEVKELEESLKKWLPKEKITMEVSESETALGSEGVATGFKKIDVSVGLGYTGGNVSMYQALIKDFALSVGEKKDLINQCVEKEDVARFTIEVHSLKSTAKTLGAVSLSETAYELEKLGHKRDLESIRSKINDLNAEINLVMEDLSPYMFVNEKKIQRIPVEREKVREALRNLFYAADDFDYDKARTIIFDLGNYQYDDRLETVYVKMRDSIEDIDYDSTRKGALEMLANI